MVKWARGVFLAVLTVTGLSLWGYAPSAFAETSAPVQAYKDSLPLNPVQSPDDTSDNVVFEPVCVTSRIMPPSEGPYGDIRVRQWSQQYRACEYTALLDSVEDDLRSGAPHMFAPFVWTQAQYALEGTLKDWKDLAAADIAPQLGHLPQLIYLYRSNQNAAAIDYIYDIPMADIAVDPWALLHASWIDGSVQNSREQIYLLTLLKNYPDLYVSWWPSTWYSREAIAEIESLISEGGVLHEHPGAEIFRRYVFEEDRDDFMATEAWLEHFPNDHYAHWRRAAEWRTRYQWGKAHASSQRSLRAFPFHTSNREIDTLLRLERPQDAADRAASRIVQRGQDGTIAPLSYYLTSLIQSNRMNAAKRLLDEALSGEGADQPAWLYRRAYEWERDVGRPAQALHFAQRAFDHADAIPVDADNLMKALRADGKFEESLLLYSDLQERFGVHTEAQVLEAADAATALKDYDQAKRLLTARLQMAPNDINLLWALADHNEKSGDHASALDIWKQIIQVHRGYSGLIGRYLGAHNAVYGSDGLDDAITWLRTFDHQFFATNTAYLNRLRANNRSSDLLRVARTFVQDYPNSAQSWIDLTGAEEYVPSTAPNWKEDLAILRARSRNMAPEKREQIARIGANNIRWFTQSQLTQRDDNLLESAKLWLDDTDYYSDRIRRFDVERLLARLMSDKESKALAFERLYKADATNADSISTAFHMSDSDVHQQGFVALNRALGINRWEEERLRDYLHYHTRWGGSKIAAYCMAEWVKAEYPEAYPGVRHREAQLLGELGLRGSHMESAYLNSTRVGSSQRYIGWYETERSQAQNGDVVFEVDCDDHTMVQADDTGLVKIDQTDPRSAKPTFIGEGRSWKSFAYNDAANVTHMADHTGREIQLVYNEQQNISSIVSGDDLFQFEYNESGQPNRIEKVDLGYIDVEYDSFGEILKVEGHALNEEGSSQTIALTITQTFQKLLSLADVKTHRAWEPSDAFYVALDEANRSDGDLPALTVLLNAAVKDGQIDLEDAGLISLMIEGVLPTLASANTADEIAQFASSYHAYHQTMHPLGLAYSDWTLWASFLRSMEAADVSPVIATARAALDDAPLVQLPYISESPTMGLEYPGFWSRHLPIEFSAADERSGIYHNDVFVRKSGEVISASSLGLLRYNDDHWRRYTARADRRGWQKDNAGDLPARSVELLALQETSDGHLLIGSSEGLLVWSEGQVDGAVNRIDRAGGDSLGAVLDIHVQDGQVWLATRSGLIQFDETNVSIEAGRRLSNVEVDFFAPFQGEGSAIVGDKEGVHIIDASGNRVTTLSWDRMTSASQLNLQGSVLLEKDGSLFVTHLREGNYTPIVPLIYAASAQMGQNSSGLITVQENGLPRSVALGETGFAVWANGSFQHLRVANTDQLSSVQAMHARNGQFVLADGRGALHLYTSSTAPMILEGKVKDFAYQPQTGLVFSASSDGIVSSVPGAAFPNLIPYDFVSGSSYGDRFVEIDPAGRLISNAGRTILRYEVGESSPTELFDVDDDCPADGCDQSFNKVTSLLAASDGSIWVSIGPSVWRWQDGNLESWNGLDHDKEFPLRTHAAGPILELPNGDILIGASREGHLSHRGIPLNGQNLVYNGGTFEILNKSALFTSVTPISDGVILGSTSGFYQIQDGRLESMGSSTDPSYQALRTEHPNLYLGGKGVRLSSGLLLFPTAAGIIAYDEGQWFYPDRLNWRLPRQHLAGRGSRHLYALELDDDGNLYAATDTGVVTFPGVGNAPEEFFTLAGRPDLALSSSERRKLVAERDIILNAIAKSDSDAAEKVKTLLAASEEIEGLRAELDRGPLTTTVETASTSSDEAEPAGRFSADRLSAIRSRLEQRNRVHRALLAELEVENPVLHQQMEIRPIDVASLQSTIADDAALLQFIPNTDELILNFVTPERHLTRKVKISREQLDQLALRTHQILRREVPKLNSADGKADGAAAQEELALLYEALIAPIENQLVGVKTLYIIPTGALKLVPYPALRRVRPDLTQFAVERINIAVIPTAYALNLPYRGQSLYSDEAMVFGNPDLTLDAAEQEASIVQKALSDYGLNSSLHIGPEATRGKLEDSADSLSLLHLATHARLDSQSPDKSYIVLANGDRLGIVDIMLLPLERTRVTFLSACETGLGANGLEFATLVRAFNNAGVPSIVGSLWKVGDQPTQRLVENYYKEYDGDAAEALASAQIAMINSGGRFSHPAAWSGFEVFGGTGK